MEAGWIRRMLIVEDEPLMACLLAEALRNVGFETSIAPDARTGRVLVDDFDPDIALIDIALGEGPSGVHLAHALRKAHAAIGLVLLSQHSDAARAAGMRLPDGVAFLRKQEITDVATLMSAIDAAVAGGIGLPPRHDRAPDDSPIELTGQAARVLELLAKGYDNTGIAERMNLSVKSVERWLQHIYAALDIPRRGGVNPRVEAARRYISSSGIPERNP